MQPARASKSHTAVADGLESTKDMSKNQVVVPRHEESQEQGEELTACNPHHCLLHTSNPGQALCAHMSKGLLAFV